MELVYSDAAELTLLTGVRHEVDHIYPIKGRKSCGLHVPSNLQVITWKENNHASARGNRPNERAPGASTATATACGAS